MDHPQVITTLDTLLPEVIRTKDPHQVFLKAANERRWSPAQLEHVGQTFNTLKTVNFLDKTAGEDGRGGSFKLLDVPALVDDYVSAELPVNGKAAWGALDNEWLDKRAMEKAASEPVLDGVSEWMDSADTMLKASADECHVPHLANIMCAGEPMSSYTEEPVTSIFAQEAAQREKRAALNVIKHNSMILEDYAMDEDAKANEAFRKISSYGSVLPEVIQDMKVHMREDFNKVAVALESYGDRYGFELDLNPPDKDLRHIVEDRHNAEPFFKMALDAVENLETVRFMLDEMQKQAVTVYSADPTWQVEEALGRHGRSRGTTAKSDKSAPRVEKAEGKRDEWISQRRRDSIRRSRGTTAKSDKSAPREEKAEGKPNGDDHKRTDKAEAGGTEKKEQRTEPNKPKEEPTLAPKEEGSSYPLKEKETSDGVTPLVHGLSSGLEGLSALPGRMGTAGRDAIDSHSQGMAELIDAIRPLKNERQMSVDEAVTEAQEKATIQSLLLTDPILSKEDPQEVLNLYESLRNADPKMAADPNTLKMALREAISYEGIPQHALKDMTERRERAAKAEQAEQDLAKAKYAL